LIRRRLIAIAAGAGAALLLLPLPARPQNYPRDQVRIVVPFPAGGATDVLARVLSHQLQALWGQAVIADYRPGAAGLIGTRQVVAAPADGQTLLMASTGAILVLASSQPGGGSYDIAPISLIAAPPYILVVNPALAVSNAAELIAYAKANPGKLSYGSSGVGSASHLSGALFAQLAGIELLHVPYRGTGPAVTDLLGGRIDVMFAPGPVVQQFVQSGQLKALGVTDTQRSKFYPDVPTVADAVRGYESVGWFGLLAPPNTPPDIVRKLNEAIVAAMQTQDFRDHLATLGAEPRPQTPEEFGRYINADVAKWSKLVKDNDVQLPGGK
jgi:tripartite-type tricarboxylate transporter receptor subunit TctC